jgi:hypothetical protein
LQVEDERYAVKGGDTINPGSVQGSLKRAFGDRFDNTKVSWPSWWLELDAEPGPKQHRLQLCRCM